VLELVKEWMIIVLEFAKEVDDYFDDYLITEIIILNSEIGLTSMTSIALY